MSARWSLAVCAIALVSLAIAQSTGARRWQRYEQEMQNPADDPPDAWEKTEFAFARLRYHSFRDRTYRRRWGVDANKSERQFIQGLRRLSRIHARSVEEILDIDTDQMFDWPWMYAVGAGDWSLTEEHAARLRRYFERGGFLMVDDFHNEREWEGLMNGLNRAIPGARVVELQDDDPIFHTVFSLENRFRVPGLNVVHGSQIERGGVDPHWRAVVDGQNRVIVAMCFNMDLGDAWEWADLPRLSAEVRVARLQNRTQLHRLLAHALSRLLR